MYCAWHVAFAMVYDLLGLLFVLCRVFSRTVTTDEDRAFMVSMESEAAAQAIAVVALSHSDADFIQTHLSRKAGMQIKAQVRSCIQRTSLVHSAHTA